MSSVCRGGVLLSLAAAAAADEGHLQLFTMSGFCDALNGLNGVEFAHEGHTISGAPYFKARDQEKYMYYDLDCAGGGDGAPRWIIDSDKPDVNKRRDLDNDGTCIYDARVNTNDITRPPAAAEWTMNCEGRYVKRMITLHDPNSPDADAHTTSRSSTQAPSSTQAASSTTKEAADHSTGTDHSAPAARYRLKGMCSWKGFLNNAVFEFAGQSASGANTYRARGSNFTAYIYHDLDCNGGSDGRARWIIDNSVPDLTRIEDLDHDGKCSYHARLDSDAHSQLPTSATWAVWCGTSWRQLPLTFSILDDATSPSASTTSQPRDHNGVDPPSDHGADSTHAADGTHHTDGGDASHSADGTHSADGMHSGDGHGSGDDHASHSADGTHDGMHSGDAHGDDHGAHGDDHGAHGDDHTAAHGDDHAADGKQEGGARRGLKLGGACAGSKFFNDVVFEQQGTTASGAPYYKGTMAGEARAFYIYYDPACSGAHASPAVSPRWVLDESKPDVHSAEDLDGDHKCEYHARSDEGDATDVPRAAKWRMYCGTAWEDVTLSFAETQTNAVGSPGANGSGDKVVSAASRAPLAAAAAALIAAAMA